MRYAAPDRRQNPNLGSAQRIYRSGPHVLAFDPAAHRYRLDGRNVPSVTNVLMSEGFGDIYQTFSREQRDEWLFRGSWVHAMAAAKVRKDFDPQDPVYLARADEFAGYLRALDSFLSDPIFKPVIVETPVADPRWGYAGTPDMLGHWQDEPAIVDLKTGTVLELYTELQTGAYAAALGWLKDTYEFADRRHRRIAVELRGDGTWRPVEMQLTRAASYFLAALSLHNLKLNHGGNHEITGRG